jgi:C_GCAxxG_C_C family probable redox protein
MLKKENTIQIAYSKGKDYEARATDCCQCTIAAVQDAIGCRNDDILRAGSALAGGLAFTGQGTCGALVGAVMVVGQLYGRTREEFDKDAQKEIREVDWVNVAKGWDLAYELFEWFRAEYGTIICSDIKKKLFGENHEDYIRPNSPARSALSKKSRGYEKGICPGVVALAAQWATEIILRKGLPEECPERHNPHM